MWLFVSDRGLRGSAAGADTGSSCTWGACVCVCVCVCVGGSVCQPRTTSHQHCHQKCEGNDCRSKMLFVSSCSRPLRQGLLAHGNRTRFLCLSCCSWLHARKSTTLEAPTPPHHTHLQVRTHLHNDRQLCRCMQSVIVGSAQPRTHVFIHGTCSTQIPARSGACALPTPQVVAGCTHHHARTSHTHNQHQQCEATDTQGTPSAHALSC